MKKLLAQKTVLTSALIIVALSFSGCGQNDSRKQSHEKAATVLALAKSSPDYFAKPSYDNQSGELDVFMLYKGTGYGKLPKEECYVFLSSPKDSNGMTTDEEWAAAKALSDKRVKQQLSAIANPTTYVVSFESSMTGETTFSVYLSLESKESVFSFNEDGYHQQYLDAANGRIISLDKFFKLQQIVKIESLLKTPGVKVTARDGQVFFTPPQKDALRTTDGEISVSADDLEANAPETYKKALRVVTK
jgi:hypothetical protein